MRFSPMPLATVREPFSDPDWVFEPKYDGFRALAYIDGHHCQLVSRRGNAFKSWPYLCEELAHAYGARPPFSTAKSPACSRTDAASSTT